MAAGAVWETQVLAVARVRVTLLGPFSIKHNERNAGPWYRPAARRLCQLVMVTPSHRLGREVAREVLFPKLAPSASAGALSTALSLAREALAPLGPPAGQLLRANRANIWVDDEVQLDIDAETQEAAIRSALRREPGAERDAALSGALKQDGVLLDEEPYANWAVTPREALEVLRQRARLELARDRARGFGRSQPDAVVEAWEDCLAGDPTSEEAGSSLVRIYSVRGNRRLADITYERCRAALEARGIRASPELERVLQAGSRRPANPAPHGPPAPDATPSGEKERRLVSVLYAQLSVAPGAHSNEDPEELGSLIGAAVATLIAEAEGLGGTMTSVSGTGVVAIFGAPEAHEDDPERAVISGSRMVAAIAAASGDGGGQLLSLQVGVETGPAIVGRLWSEAGTGYAAVGSVVHVAATLASAATAGSILVGPSTRAATDGAFEWGQGGQARGGEALVGSVYLQRSRPGGAHHRGHRGLSRRAPLIGREAELAVLTEALRRTTSGNGSVLFIVGEPGLGKTRLVKEGRNRFMGWVGAGTGRLPLWMEGRCASYASWTPYGLYRQLLASWTGVGAEEPGEVVRPAFERAMRAVFGGDTGNADFLAHMLGLPAGNEMTAISRLSPESLQRAMFASVSRLVEGVAARGPAVVVLEDLHWADAISLRLTGELVRLVEQVPLLFLATLRPEPDPGVAALEKSMKRALGPRFQRLELSALSDPAERQLAQWLVGKAAGDDILAAVRKDADGNPLFLEERFSTLIETGGLVKAGSMWSLGDAPANQVPNVLERLVRSRVDRLPPLAKEAVVAASVLGPEFALSALGTVADMGERLLPAVAELCRARLLVEVGRVPEPRYRFRHAVIQEATYGGLLRRQKANLHARAAWGLEAGAAGQAEDVAAVLGYHYAMAGERDRAVHFLRMAARHAAAEFAIEEAVFSYRRALEVLEQGQRAHGRTGAAIELRAELGDVLWRTTRLSEAREVLTAALALVGPDQNLQAARLYTRLGRVEVESGFQGDTESCHSAAMVAFDAAEELLGEYREERSEEWVGIWLELLIDGRTNLHNWRSEPEMAANVLAHARDVAEVRGSPSRRSGLFVQLATQGIVQRGGAYDEETVSLTRRGVQAAQDGGDEHDLALCFTALGEALLNNSQLAEADEMLRMGLKFGERVDDPQARSWCLALRCLLEVRRHDVDAVRSLSRQARSAATTATMPLWLASATATEAWLAWKDNHYEDVLRLSHEAIDLWRTVKFAPSLGPIGLKAVCLWPLVSVHLACGRIGGAIEAGSQLLDAPDIRSPDDVQSLLSSARVAWDHGDEASTASDLNVAVALASRLGCY